MRSLRVAAGASITAPRSSVGARADGIAFFHGAQVIFGAYTAQEASKSKKTPIVATNIAAACIYFRDDTKRAINARP
jgi:hypothetical protein